MASGPAFPARPLFIAFILLFATLAVTPPATAQSAPEYRGYWVETFNTALGTRAEIDRVIGAAVDSKANALFAQIRRRGDSWYLDSVEPLTQVAGVGSPGPDGTWTFDPLQYLIEQAHTRNIEVHAFVIVGSIYNAHPTITGTPRDPRHVFNQHFWDQVARAPYPTSDPRQWSTRSLPHNPDGTTFDGQRYTAEWYVDLGHPDAEAYTVDVLTHLVDRYDLDGLHLDRIRYPEAPIDRAGPVATWGINVGYNETSVQRFKARHGDAAGYYTAGEIGLNVNTAAAPRRITAADVGYPRTNDPLWNDWRREQVSNFVRRLYLSVTAVKPRIKVSAALICFWTGPVGSGSWERTEAYYRVFQDWQSWAQEGTLDILSPMIYKREHIAVERAQFDDWLSFTKTLAQTSGRHALPGLGNYLNGVEGTLVQARRGLGRAPFNMSLAPADGVLFYALGNTTPGSTANSTSAAVTLNPFSYPVAGVTTPKRTNVDFFSAVTTSANAAGTVLFEDPGNGPLFTVPLATPDMPWKSAPTQGHVMGFARLPGGTPLDGGALTITALSTGASRTAPKTDGGGFYGGVGLAPGSYRARVEHGSVRLDVCRFDIAAGRVTSADARLDAAAPSTTGTIDPGAPLGDNGWYVGDVRLFLTAEDDCSGVARTEYSVDGGETWQAYAGAILLTSEGTARLAYRSVDDAGNVETASALDVRIDKTDPSVSLTSDHHLLWPADGRIVQVTLSGSAADETSGLAGVSYALVDEYGSSLGIEPRLLEGGAATWSDVIGLMARRDGIDFDGRQYTIVATVRDAAGRMASATVGVLVPHDRRDSAGR
jgi:uncharacterized lipoprotein YddW (UPF0748 family)